MDDLMGSLVGQLKIKIGLSKDKKIHQSMSRLYHKRKRLNDSSDEELKHNETDLKTPKNNFKSLTLIHSIHEALES